MAKTHGLTKTRLFRIWTSMKNRCHNVRAHAYSQYGGRGISVCEEWRNDVVAFKNWAMDNGYADHLTIDRIDVNDDYSPHNCRWVSYKTQQNNRRNNVIIEYNGETHTLAEWEEISGLGVCLRERIKHKWSIKDAFETPKQTSGYKIKFKTGKSPKIKTGLSHTSTYRAWSGMRYACLNPKHRGWSQNGGRGVKICKEWIDSFENFLTDMGIKPDGYALLRKDQNKDFCKENCEWAPRSEIARRYLNKPT